MTAEDAERIAREVLGQDPSLKKLPLYNVVEFIPFYKVAFELPLPKTVCDRIIVVHVDKISATGTIDEY